MKKLTPLAEQEHALHIVTALDDLAKTDDFSTDESARKFLQLTIESLLYIGRHRNPTAFRSFLRSNSEKYGEVAQVLETFIEKIEDAYIPE